MGDWSHEPFGNDWAQEWLVNSIIAPMLDTIGETVDRYLADQTDDVDKLCAEAAVALLIDLADLNDRPKHAQFDAATIIVDKGLNQKSSAAMELLLSQTDWLTQWGNSHKKAEIIRGLLNDLKVVSKKGTPRDLSAG